MARLPPLLCASMLVASSAAAATSSTVKRVCFAPQLNSCAVIGCPGCGVKMYNATTESRGDCCALCTKSPSCVFYNWNHAIHTSKWNGGPMSCVLYSSPPSVKVPVHPMQTQCDVGAVGVLPPPPPPAPKGAKNVLYILVDDLRTELEPYGHAFVKTPALARFAASANTMRFEHAHVQSQMCVPTRNSFLSGRRPAVTRVFNDGVGEAHFRVVGQNWTSMGQHLKENGWFSTGVGKTYHPNSPPKNDPPTWSNLTDPNPAYVMPYGQIAVFKCPNTTAGGLTSDVWCNIRPSQNLTFEDEEIATESIRRMRILAVDAKRAQDDQLRRPFFLNVGFHKPHTPYRAPQEFFDLYDLDSIATAKHPNFPAASENISGLAWFSCKAEGQMYPISSPHVAYTQQQQKLLRRAYYASVSFTDSLIGRLLDELEALNLADNTVVVMHGDHGYQLGERNIWCKETNFNLAAHVPLFIRAPHIEQKPNASSGQIVEIIDVYPTVAELAGCPPLDPPVKGEPPLGGRSLAPLLRAGGVLPSFNVSYSQYSRKRCLSNLFYPVLPDGSSCGATSHWTGYSARTLRYRYTRWVNVTAADPEMPPGTGHDGGYPIAWDDTDYHEELYDLTAYMASGDDCDVSSDPASSGANLAYSLDAKVVAALDKMRALLKAEFNTSKGAAGVKTDDPTFPSYGSQFSMQETAYQNGVYLLTRKLLWDSKKAGGSRTSFYSVEKTKFQLQLLRCDLTPHAYWSVAGVEGADPSTFTCTKTTGILANCPSGAEWRPFWVPPFHGATFKGTDVINGVKCNRFIFTEPMGTTVFWGTASKPCRSNVTTPTLTQRKDYLNYTDGAPPSSAFEPPAYVKHLKCKCYGSGC